MAINLTYHYYNIVNNHGNWTLIDWGLFLLNMHYGDVTSFGNQDVAQQLVRANNNGNTQDPYYWPTFRERWAMSSPYKGPEMGTFPIHGGIMNSVSCDRERQNRYIFILEIDSVD